MCLLQFVLQKNHPQKRDLYLLWSAKPISFPVSAYPLNCFICLPVWPASHHQQQVKDGSLVCFIIFLLCFYFPVLCSSVWVSAWPTEAWSRDTPPPPGFILARLKLVTGQHVMETSLSNPGPLFFYRASSSEGTLLPTHRSQLGPSLSARPSSPAWAGQLV